MDGRTYFVSPSLRADVSQYPFTAPPQHQRTVVLGVRPEHIALAPSGDAPLAGHARVSLVEPMGAHQVVWLDAQGVSLAVNADAQFNTLPDDRIGFAIDAAQLSLFDLLSQQRL